jgi:hypothetical protein
MQWFRMYSEFAGDPVIQSLAFEDQRHYVVLLCIKSDGTLDKILSPQIRERVICRALGLDPLSASEAKRRLIEVGLITKDWQPCGWERRQFVSDSSTERVRKYRKSKETGNVTGNVTETLTDRSGNAPDTDTDTDTDKEKNKQKKKGAQGAVSPPAPAFDPLAITLPEAIPRDVWIDFVAHRKKVKAPLTELACKNLFAEISRWPANCDVVRAFQKCMAGGKWVVPYQPEPRKDNAAHQTASQRARERRAERDELIDAFAYGPDAH